MQESAPRQSLRFSIASLMIAVAIICAFLAAYYQLGVDVLPVWWLMGLAVAAVVTFRRKHFGMVAGVVAIALLSCCLISLPTLDSHRPAWRSVCQNNIRQLCLSLHHYVDKQGHFPLAAEGVAPGDPAQSWRVALLPYVDRSDVYRSYNLHERWDSRQNSQLAVLPINEYRCFLDERGPVTGQTSYFAITGNETCWPPEVHIKLRDLRDGLSNTILLVEHHRSGVAWSEPRDLDASTMNWKVNAPSGDSISSRHGPYVRYFDGSTRMTGASYGASVVCADGSTHFVSNNIDPEVLKQLVQRRDGKPKEWPDF